MTEALPHNLELEVSEALRDEIVALSHALERAHLTADVKDVRRAGTADAYESEVAVWVCRDETVVDAIYYRVFANGQPRLSVVDAVENLRRELETLLSDA